MHGFAYACQDVYEWKDGTLSLITPGTGQYSVLIGATKTGDEVFFFTPERLVGWDVDLGKDVYVAKVGGGFPEPPPSPPACDLSSGACEGPGSVASATPGAGSAAFQGPEDPPAAFQKRCPRGKRKVTRKGKTRCVAKKRQRQNRAAKHNRRAAR